MFHRKSLGELIDNACDKLIEHCATPRGTLEMTIAVFTLTAIGVFVVTKLGEDNEQENRYDIKL
jgi:hypothetical protein